MRKEKLSGEEFQQLFEDAVQVDDPDSWEIEAVSYTHLDVYKRQGVDETTDYFGPQTSQAIRYFQRKHGLTAVSYTHLKA